MVVCQMRSMTAVFSTINQPHQPTFILTFKLANQSSISPSIFHSTLVVFQSNLGRLIRSLELELELRLCSG